MIEFGFDSKLLSLVERAYEEKEVKFMLERMESKWFRTTLSVRQGCPLLALVFHIYVRAGKED